MNGFTERRSSARRRQAFTLIEMVVVVALLAILLSVAVPPFFRGLGWARMSGSARALVTMAKFARFHAIMHGRPVFLAIDMVGNRFSLAAEPPEGVVVAWSPDAEGTWDEDAGYGWGVSTGFGEDPWDPMPVDGDGGYSGNAGAEGPGDDGFLAGLAAIRPYDVPSQVKLDTFVFAESERLDADKAAVVFLPDGTCQEFSLLLEDHRGRRLEVWFDPLTGQPEVYTPGKAS